MAYFFGKGAGAPLTDFRQTRPQAPQGEVTSQATSQTGSISPIDPDDGGAGQKFLACQGGTCQEVEVSTPEARAACNGKNVGDACSDGSIQPVCPGGYKISVSEECPPGQIRKSFRRVENGQQILEWYCCPKDPIDPIDPETPCEGGYKLADKPIAAGGGNIWTDTVLKPEHGWSRNSKAEGHYVWHPDWGYQFITDVHKFVQGQGSLTKNTVGACAKGFVKTGENCCPGEGGGGGGGTLGEFKFPPRLQNLMQLLLGRGEEFLTREPGFSDEAIQNMFGRDFENIRGLGDVSREQELRSLQSQGLLGTEAERDVASGAAWRTESNVGNLIRDLFVLNEQQTRKDLLDFTGAGQNILGAGTGFFGAEEQFNAGRRGEEFQNFALLLQYLTSLLGSFGS